MTKNRFFQILLVALAYFVAGRLGLLLAIPPGFVSTVWPAAGIAIASCLIFGLHSCIGVLIGSFFVNFTNSGDILSINDILNNGPVTLSIAVGTLLQSLVGAYVIQKKYTKEIQLERGSEIIGFLFITGPLSCLISSIFGTFTLFLFNFISSDVLLFTWFTWWTGDSIGAVVIAPIVISLFQKTSSLWKSRRISYSLPISMMFILIVTFFVFAKKWEEQRQANTFQKRAHSIISNFNQMTFRYNLSLSSLVSFYKASEDITKEEFKVFVESTLKNNVGIRALSWNPVIYKEQRKSFEDMP